MGCRNAAAEGLLPRYRKIETIFLALACCPWCTRYRLHARCPSLRFGALCIAPAAVRRKLEAKFTDHGSRREYSSTPYWALDDAACFHAKEVPGNRPVAYKHGQNRRDTLTGSMASQRREGDSLQRGQDDFRNVCLVTVVSSLPSSYDTDIQFKQKQLAITRLFSCLLGLYPWMHGSIRNTDWRSGPLYVHSPDYLLFR